ncbi:MAG TPA: VOC family protein [Blastocatellia bacterium]|nr:VOC family protein [Blastocatellia bacterium]
MPTVTNPTFHHIEIPCGDLDLAERFYSTLLGAEVYMRRDAGRTPGVPATGTIADAESAGFNIDGTYMRIGGFRIGFLKQPHEQRRLEVDHLAFMFDDETRVLLDRLRETGITILDESRDRILIEDPFGLTLELWERAALERMGLA